MRVLFCHELFPPQMRGGGELIAYESARALKNLGVDVTVITTGSPEIREYENIETRRLPISRYRLNFAISSIREAAANADVIQTFNYHACLPSLAAGRLSGKPVSCMMLGFFGDTWLETKGPILGRAWRAFERWQMQANFDSTIFISNYSLEHARRLGISPTNPLVLHPGIEDGRFGPGEKSGPVLFTGKFDIRKGVFEVIEVARALPEIPFCLYGWGPEERALRNAAPPNVEIINYSDYRALELPGLLAAAPICILPSRAETFGLALVQAMASGCAIVSSIPLPFEGRRVEPTDVQAMIEATAQLWNDKQQAGMMGARNAAMAADYTWDRFARGLLANYRMLLGEGRISN